MSLILHSSITHPNTLVVVQVFSKLLIDRARAVAVSPQCCVSSSSYIVNVMKVNC